MRWLGRYGRDRRGNIAAMMALLIVPLVGVMGVATEAGTWFVIQRSAQNAADSAAVAAATNGTGTSIAANQTYVQEGQGVASNFGFVNGTNSTVVTVTYPDNTVPAKCNSKCYAVTITRTVPVYLSRIVGWGATQAVAARSVAVAQDNPTKYCLVSLGGGDAFHINGGNSIDLTGCNVLANGDVTCNGSNASGNATSITYLSSNKKCSPAVQEAAAFPDPYASKASSIPANPCGSYWQSGGKNNPPPVANQINVSQNWSSQPVVSYCGDVVLGNGALIQITTAGTGTVLVIYNGSLIMNGATLQTLSGSGLTIIFSGTNGGGYTHIPSGGGTLDIQAPTAGGWHGFAIYQDPALTSGVDLSAAGNSPTWDVSGVIYMPNADLQFSGSVNKSSNGLDCFVLVDSTFQSNGTGAILEHESQCIQQGVNVPQSSTTKRTALVY